MSHEVETMAYTNQVPWHGLGTHIADAPSVEDMVKIAGLDWTVEKRPLMTAVSTEPRGCAEFNVPVPGKFALTRDSDNRVLSVVGNHYRPVQNVEAFSFFKDFVEAGDATMETAGSLKHGGYVWGLANLGQSFKLAGKDEVKGYLLVGSPHEQGKAFIIRFTSVRVVCNNTLTLALSEGGGEFRMSHRSEFNETMIEKAKDTLGIAREQMSEFEKNARLLKRTNMGRDDTIKVLAPMYQPQTPVEELIADFDNEATTRMKTLMDINERAPGADPKTAWGVLNAVTYYADHVASRTADKRMTNAWLGKTARQKETVLNTLLDTA